MTCPSLDDAKDRVERAINTLNNMIDEYWEASERNRLRGKVEGLKLALSYIEQEERIAGDG